MTSIPTILIVDDEPVGREVLASLLHQQDYKLIFADNGNDALLQAATHKPDLVLLDVMMTGMDGFEVCRHLRADRVLAEVPIILLTALDDRESRLQGIAAGADDFLSKPFDRSELRLRVQTITRLNRYRRLNEERARLSWVVEHSDEAYLIIDSQDRIMYANDRARLYFGLEKGELNGEHTFRELADQLYRCEPQDIWEAWPNINTAVLPPCYLVRPESPTSQALWLHVELNSSLDMDQRLVRLRDVTRELGIQHDSWTFHTSILHKLRTPLSGIIVSMNLLHERLNRMEDPMLPQVSEIALRGAQRLNDQISQILSYIEAGRVGRMNGMYPLGELPALVEEIRELLAIQDVAVIAHEAAGAYIVMLQRQTLEMIFIELLNNAKKFHPHQNPHIDVTITPIDSQTVRIQVIDDGVVLSPEQLTHVLHPYYQAEKHFTGEVQGMGLGLTMVATRLWSAGGSCEIANRQDGSGIVVSLNIPCAMLIGIDMDAGMDDDMVYVDEM